MPSSRKIEFTLEAQADPREILQYGRETGGEAQRDTYAALRDRAFALLADFPELGPARPDLFPGCRIHPVKQHVISYRIVERGIRVIRVLSARADAAALLADTTGDPS